MGGGQGSQTNGNLNFSCVFDEFHNSFSHQRLKFQYFLPFVTIINYPKFALSFYKIPSTFSICDSGFRNQIYSFSSTLFLVLQSSSTLHPFFLKPYSILGQGDEYLPQLDCFNKIFMIKWTKPTSYDRNTSCMVLSIVL